MAKKSKAVCLRYLYRLGVEACSELERWGLASVSCPSPERVQGLRAWRPCLQVGDPCRMWLLSLMLLIGLSGCGPGEPDPSANAEPRASLTSLSGLSESSSVLQEKRASFRNDSAKPAMNDVPIGINPVPVLEQKKDFALIPGQKEALVPRSDRSASPDRTAPSSETPGFLPTMNVWTQEGIPISIVVPEDPIDYAAIEEEVEFERRNWEIAHEIERGEDDTGQEELPGERKE